MADWFLNPALTAFRKAVNAKYGARRDHESDGTVGDRAHQNSTSDHNPDGDGSVDAWDMDVDVNGRDQPHAADVEALKRVFEAHESSGYWIHNDQIARRVDGWRRRPYTDFNSSPARNKHIKHVHWNTRQSHETSNAPWILGGEDDDMPTVKELLDTRIGSQALGERTFADWLKGGQSAVAKVEALAAELRLRDAAMLAAVQGDADRDVILAAVDQRAAELVAEVNQVAAETVEALGDLDTPAEIAERLRAVLGDKAAAVGALLVGQQA